MQNKERYGTPAFDLIYSSVDRECGVVTSDPPRPQEETAVVFETLDSAKTTYETGELCIHLGFEEEEDSKLRGATVFMYPDHEGMYSVTSVEFTPDVTVHHARRAARIAQFNGIRRRLARLRKEVEAFKKEQAKQLQPALTEDEIAAVIKSHQAEQTACSQAALLRNPIASGKIQAIFVIGGNGRVDTTQIIDDTANDAIFVACIKNALMSWSFPKPRGGEEVEAYGRFTFGAP